MDTNYALLFKALSDNHRLKLLELLIQGETCGCTLINKLPISQPTLSYHLKMLTNIGLTKTYKEGTWVKHHVDLEVIDQLILFLQNLKLQDKPCDIK